MFEQHFYYVFVYAVRFRDFIPVEMERHIGCNFSFFFRQILILSKGQRWFNKGIKNLGVYSRIRGFRANTLFVIKHVRL